MEKKENEIIDPIVDDTIDTETYPAEEIPVVDEVPVDAPVEDPTLAQTDEVIPAVTDAPVEAPVEVPAEEPVLDAPLADIVPPVADIPVEPEPVVEEPCDGCCDDPNCACNAGENCATPVVTIGQFFGTIQECVTIAWRFHLKTRKHHIHVTLNEFYEKALDVVDDIIEQYQGICGVVEEPFVNCVVGDGKTESEYLSELKTFVTSNKSILGECNGEIFSTIDEFLALIDSTLYKLNSFCEHAVKSFDEFCYENLNESCGCSEKDIKDPDLEYGESFGESCGEEEEE